MNLPNKKIDLWQEMGCFVGFAVLVLYFLALKSFSLHWEIGDENIYYYMAWAASDHGALPYRDYFFAHPPLHLLPGILLFKIAGFGEFTARIIPVGATVMGSVFLFLLVKQHVGRLASLAALFIYLTAFDLLRASSHWTGINLSVMWMIVGLWALLNRKPMWSGCFMALGVCTGNYVLPGAMMAGALTFLQEKKAGFRYLLGFAVPWGAVQICCLFLGGNSYLDGVYRYHVQKPDAAGASTKMMARVFGDNFSLFLGMLLGTVMAVVERLLQKGGGHDPAPEPDPKEQGKIWRRAWLWLRQTLWQSGSRGLAWMLGLYALGTMLFIGMLPRVFPFYFLLMFPAMAFLGGFALDRLVRHGIALIRLAKKRGRAWWEAVATVALILLGVLVLVLVRVPLQRSLLPNYVRAQDRPMKWSDSPYLFAAVNQWLRSCCFPDVAKAYQDYPSMTELLFHENQFFEKAGDLAEYVKAHSQPDQTLFGDSSTAGLVALLAGRKVAGDEVDTNVMRFRSGITQAADLIQKIDTPSLAFVLVSGRMKQGRDGPAPVYGMFASLPEFRRWLEEGFQVAFQVQDRTKGWFFLLQRKEQVKAAGE